MKEIPRKINEVTIEFKDSVNRNITDEMHSALLVSISKEVVNGYNLEKLLISSGSEQIDVHKCPSRHKTGNAVDISRINEKKIGEHYTTDPSVKAIVDALQTKFESVPHRRENFGPTIEKKLGNPYPLPEDKKHNDHFHWSVNGDHSKCIGAFRRMIEWMRLDRFFSEETNNSQKQVEICNK